MFSPSGDKLDRVKSTGFTFESSGFTAVSYYNGTLHFIGTPKSGDYSGQTNEYVLNLNYMNYFPCSGVNFMNNYAGKSLLGDGITYTLSSNLPYIYTFDWGNTEVIESHQKLVEDAVGAMTYYNGKIYYTELYRSPSSNSEIIHLKLKSYDLSTKEIVELHSGDFFTSKYMSTAGRLCVMNDKLFYLTETYRGYDFPVYNLVTGEVKYCHP